MDDLFDQLLKEKTSDNEEDQRQENEAEDSSSKRKVKPIRRGVRGTQPTLNHMRLTGSRGIGVIEDTAKEVVFKGKGYEKEDLAKTITFLHHWAHRLYPRMNFEDCLEKIEQLGKKRPLQTYLHKIRAGMIEESTVGENLSSKEVTETQQQQSQVLTPELKERILQNRLLAQAKRAAKLNAIRQQGGNDTSVNLDS